MKTIMNKNLEIIEMNINTKINFKKMNKVIPIKIGEIIKNLKKMDIIKKNKLFQTRKKKIFQILGAPKKPKILGEIKNQIQNLNKKNFKIIDKIKIVGIAMQ